MVFSIFRSDQDEVVEPYVEKFLDAAPTVIDTLGFHKASVVLEFGFPLAVGSPEVVARLDEWLAASADAPTGARALRRRGPGGHRPGAGRAGARRPLTGTHEAPLPA